jgi:putative membrane protein
LKRFLIRLVINAVALYAAIYIVPGIQQPAGATWVSLLWLALIFGVVNAILRPIAMLFSLPLIILSLGIFTLVLNTLLFAFTGWLGNQFGVGFTLAEPWFVTAFLGSLVATLISMLLSALLRDELKNRHRREGDR